jgi:hypothetical protein
MSKQDVTGETSHNGIFNYLMYGNMLGWESKALKFWSFCLSYWFICLVHSPLSDTLITCQLSFIDL